MTDTIHVVLVENNSYDRAVLDAALSLDENIHVSYSRGLPSNLEIVGPFAFNDIDWRPGAEKIALLDLALTKSCERVLATKAAQETLQTADDDLRALGLHLAKWGHLSAQVVELTWGLVRLAESDAAHDIEFLEHFLSREWHQDLEIYWEPLRTLNSGDFYAPEELAAAALSGLERLFRYDVANIRQVVKPLSGAPSLGRLLSLVVDNPDVCFFAVSHYINATTKNGVARILMAGQRSTGTVISQYFQFLIDKSDLADLPDRLRRGHLFWRRELHNDALQPFGGMLLVNENDDEIGSLADIVTEWLTVRHFPDFPELTFPPGSAWPLLSLQRVSSRRKFLWDETGCLTGQALSWRRAHWEEVFRHFQGLRVIGLPKVLPEGDEDICFVVEGWRAGRDAGVALARAISRLLPSGDPRYVYFVAAGTAEALDGLQSSLGEERMEYLRLPLIENEFRLWDILLRVRVTKVNGSYVPHWIVPNSQSARKLEEELKENLSGLKHLPYVIARDLVADAHKGQWEALWTKFGGTLARLAEKRGPRDARKLVKKLQEDYFARA